MDHFTHKRRSLVNQIKAHPYNYSFPSNIFQTTSLQHFDFEDKYFAGDARKSLSEIYAPQKLLYSKHSRNKSRGHREKNKARLALSKKKGANKKTPPQNLLYHWLPKIYNETKNPSNQGFGDTKENTIEGKPSHKKGGSIYEVTQQDYNGETLVAKYTKMEQNLPDIQEQILTDETKNEGNRTSNSPRHSLRQTENESLISKIANSEEKKHSLSGELDKEKSSNNLKDEAEEKAESFEKRKSNDKVETRLNEQLISNESNTLPLIDKESSKSSDVQREPSISSDVIFESTSIIKELEETYQHLYETTAQVDILKKSIEKYKDTALTVEDANEFKEKEMLLMNKLSELECITQKLVHLGGFPWLENEKDALPDLGADLYMGDQCTTPPEKPDVDVPKLKFGLEERNEELFFSDRKPKNTSLFTLKDTLKFPGNISDLTSILNNAFDLPKVVMCQTGDNLPKIVVCDPRKKLNIGGGKPGWPYPNIADSMDPKNEVVICLTDRLKESYTIQDKLVTENAHLEDFRYQLQEEVLAKEQALEDYKRRYNQLQNEMKLLVLENKQLNEKLGPRPQPKPICKKEFGKKMEENLLSRLETQMKNLQKDLQGVQVARKEAERERCKLKETAMSLRSRPVTSPPPQIPPDRNNEKILQLKEQYTRVKEDYKTKVSQVAALQVENENLMVDIEEKKKNLKEAENTIKELQEKLIAAESERDKMVGSKGQACQLIVLEQQLREAKDELEELHIKQQESSYQEEYYRGKYLLAQQQVEEQRRQIDLMDADNKRITQQVEEEMQRVKCQFQEKLDELKSLPELLRSTQCRLQEAVQKQKQAEDKICDLRIELEDARNKTQEANQKLERFWSQHDDMINQFETLKAKVDAWEKKCKDLQDTNSKLNNEMKRIEDCAAQCRRCSEEKSMEIVQLNNQLENVREESARQIAKTKDRCETVRRSYQAQVEELERQLAQSRATAHAAQSERDETRKRMQCHINNLSENFEQAQSRIRYLQSHVNHLTSSFTNMMEDTAAGCPDMGEFCDCD